MAAVLTARFKEALVYAHELHVAQKRKKTAIPYVSHLLAVCGLVLEHGGDEDEAIAALLHDAAEDQGGHATLEKIRNRFGDRVADIVDGCTDTYDEPKPRWRPRKESYLDHLYGAPSSVRLVAAADKLHNARSIIADYRSTGEDVWTRFSAPKEDTLWYYRAVVNALQSHETSPLIEELDRVVHQLETLNTGSS